MTIGLLVPAFSYSQLTLHPVFVQWSKKEVLLPMYQYDEFYIGSHDIHENTLYLTMLKNVQQ